MTFIQGGLSRGITARGGQIRAFRSINGELKFSHNVPLNADEQVCCIAGDW